MDSAAGRSMERTTPKDIFLSEVKTRDVFPLLILHIVREEPAYGNAIMARIREICAGTMSVSPNTIYPLLWRRRGTFRGSGSGLIRGAGASTR